MKTIAISIEEDMLRRLRALAASPARAGTGPAEQGPRHSVSALVREALRDFLDRYERVAREDRDRRIIAAHRRLLSRQAAALVREQARP